MSYVTTVMVISPYTTFPDEVNKFLTQLHHGDYFEEEDRMDTIQGINGEGVCGGKVAGASMMWIGWNHCPIDELIEGLQQFKELTLWWETEGEFFGLEKINWEN